MKKALALLLALLLIAGCTSNTGTINGNQTGNASVMNPATVNVANNTENLSQDVGQNQTQITNSTDYDFSRTYSDDGKLVVYFFYSARCYACKAVSPYVESIARKYDNWTEWHGFNIDIKGDRDIYQQFYKEMNLTQNRSGVPVMLLNNTILWGRYEINDSLEQLINSSIR